MASRVSRSGGSISVMRPERKRLRSRSSSVSIDFGGRSEVRTICFPAPVQVVVGVEELLLEPLLVLHELHVVDEQDVAFPVAALEGDGRRHPQRVDEVVHEGLGGDVEDLAYREVLLHVVADRVEQVGLAEPGVAVDEQRVVRAPGCLGDGLGGGVGQPVGGRGHEGVEGEPGVEGDGHRVAGIRRSVRRQGPVRAGDGGRVPNRRGLVVQPRRRRHRARRGGRDGLESPTWSRTLTVLAVPASWRGCPRSAGRNRLSTRSRTTALGTPSTMHAVARIGRPARHPTATSATWRPTPVHARMLCSVSTARWFSSTCSSSAPSESLVHSVVHRCGTQRRDRGRSNVHRAVVD